MTKSMFQRRTLAAIAFACAFAATAGASLQANPLAALPVPPKAPRGEIVGSNRAARRARLAEERRRRANVD